MKTLRDYKRKGLYYKEEQGKGQGFFAKDCMKIGSDELRRSLVMVDNPYQTCKFITFIYTL